MALLSWVEETEAELLRNLLTMLQFVKNNQDSNQGSQLQSLGFEPYTILLL